MSKEVRSVYGGHPAEPVAPGAGPVAVCTLGSPELAAALSSPSVGLAGPLNRAPHGVERLAGALLDRPHLRFLVVSGRETPALAALRALWHGEAGLPNLTAVEAAAVREQAELVDLAGVTDPQAVLAAAAACAARNPGPRRAPRPAPAPAETITAHEPETCFPAPDPECYFVVFLDRAAAGILVERYQPGGRRTHAVTGPTAEAVGRVLAGRGLVRDPAHALYLGRELQKAEVALRQKMAYEQDVPLRLTAPNAG